MKHFVTGIFIAIVNNFGFSQNLKVITGECLEDEKGQYNLSFIGADSSGIYFLKNKKDKSVYVEKYDNQSLKKVFRCQLPVQGFKGTEFKYLLANRNFFWVRNGKVYIIAASVEGQTVDFYGLCVNEDGLCKKEFEKLHTLSFKKKVKNEGINAVDMTISAGRNYLCVCNKNEIKDVTLVINLKITCHGSSVSLNRNYDSQWPESEGDFWSPLMSGDDGSVSAFYKTKSDKPSYARLGPFEQAYKKELPGLVQDGDIVFDDMAFQNMSFTGAENMLVIYNKKLKRYGFLSLVFDTVKKELVNTGLSYLSVQKTQQLGKRSKKVELLENNVYKEEISSTDHTYRIISRHDVPTFRVGVESQEFLLVMAYDKQNTLVDQKIIPFSVFDYKGGDNDFLITSDLYCQARAKNYGTMLINGSLYIFTNQSDNNRNFDPDTGITSDFDACNNVPASDFFCYIILPGGSIKKIMVADNEPNHYVHNIINNYNLFGKYQYVYVNIKGKKMLGKVVAE